MFCRQCGQELTTEQKFCPSCGHPSEEKKKLPREMLIRRAQDFSESYDVSLDINGLSVWDFEKIDEFDPLQKLPYFRQDLTRDLMEFSKYEFSREEVEILLEDIFPIVRKFMLQNLKMWFVEQYKNFYEYQKQNVTFNLETLAYSAFKHVYGLSKYLWIINYELEDWEGLQSVKTFLKFAETFKCKNETDLYGREFIREGKLLQLKEFSDVKQRYDELLKNINDSIVEINPELKEEIDEENKVSAKNETKIKKKNKACVLTSVICGVLFPFILIIQHILLTGLNDRYAGVSTIIAFLVGAVLCGILLVADIRIRSIPLVIILNIIGQLLFYPVCLGIATFVAWISKIAIFILGGIIILFVCFLHGDRMNP